MTSRQSAGSRMQEANTAGGGASFRPLRGRCALLADQSRFATIISVKNGPREELVVRHRKALKSLVQQLKARPLEFLPERSSEGLNQFFAGYGIFGPPVWRDLLSFERWLTKRLFYPQDTGARWWRFIQLNSKDGFESYELFLRLYSDYLHQKPEEIQPTAQDWTTDPKTFDFDLQLFAIFRRPGLYLGVGDSVQQIAAYLAGYFKGKKDAGLKVTKYEKEFFKFQNWLQRHIGFKKHYPWYRLVEMWPYGGCNSLECFFANYDAYLTNYGKKARGLEDRFEVISDKTSTRFQRRRKLPAKPVQIPDSKYWWRHPQPR